MSFTLLILKFGYPLLYLGSIVEGEAMLILGGLLVHQGILSLPWVFTCVFLGVFTWDVGWFFAGRVYGTRVLTRFPHISRLSGGMRRVVEKRRALASFSIRFMYGFRIFIPVALGISPIPFRTFLSYYILGALAWVCTIGTAGYLFGTILETFLGHIRHYELRVIIVVVILIAVFYQAMQFFERRVRERNFEKNS